MAGTSLNDLVTDWAALNAAEATYNAGKALLQATYTEAQIIAAGAGSYNEGLAALAASSPAVANYFTGGDVTVSGGYRYHTFNSSSTLTFVDADGLGTAVDVDYLVVAGGGGGGEGFYGGGGGAGGMLTASAVALSATQTVTIGAGGAGSTVASQRGTNGSDSSLGAVASPLGGGGGGSRNGTTITNPPSGGADGGSGGGAAKSFDGGAGTSGQGNAGAGAFDATLRYGGGGGGKGAAAPLASTTASGSAGGVGAEWPSGSGTFYAGGGSGGGTAVVAGVAGGGGDGGNTSGTLPTAGDPNTGGGGGGGGGGGDDGAAGGSGAVIVRYVDDASMPTAASDPIADFGITWHTAFWAEDPNWTAPADGFPVETWTDGSGNGRDATQATSSEQPLFTLSDADFNGASVLSGDASTDLRTASFTAATQPITAVVIGRVNIATGNRFAFDDIDGTSRIFLYQSSTPEWGAGAPTSITGGTPDTDPHLFVATYNSTSSTLEVDGVQIASGDTGTNSLTSINLFSNAGTLDWNGDLAFVGFIDGELTAKQRADIEIWANLKYGIVT